MAKGKQAALSVQRRYEAAVEHIDRLTTELVDAKQRARDLRDTAARVPAMEARMVELQRQVDAMESTGMAKLRAAHATDLSAISTELDRAIDELAALVAVNFKTADFKAPQTLIDATSAGGARWAPVRAALHPGRINREARRVLASDRRLREVDHAQVVQENGRTDVENLRRTAWVPGRPGAATGVMQ